MKQTKIISGFPGIGKSMIVDSNLYPDLRILDIDAGDYQYKGRFKEQNFNPDWPENYYLALLGGNKDVDFLLISQQPSVIKYLVDNGWRPILVYPTLKQKEVYLQKYRNRGNCGSFVSKLDDCFEAFLQNAIDQNGCDHFVLLPGQNLADIMPEILAL